MPRTGRIVVEHVNMIKKHTQEEPGQADRRGIAEKEASIAVSNVMIVCGKCGAVRIKHHVTK